jgi:hypothetical protein
MEPTTCATSKDQTIKRWEQGVMSSFQCTTPDTRNFWTMCIKQLKDESKVWWVVSNAVFGCVFFLQYGFSFLHVAYCCHKKISSFSVLWMISRDILKSRLMKKIYSMESSCTEPSICHLLFDLAYCTNRLKLMCILASAKIIFIC